MSAESPRLLERPDAAKYCGLSPDGFSAWVREGRLPGPIEGTKRWDRRAIDAALDRLSGLAGAGAEASPLDSWKSGRAS